MVETGLTVAFPEGGRAPLPGAMVTDETPVAFQLSRELPPALMLVGLAVNETTGKEGGMSEGVGSEGGVGENGVGENGVGEDGVGENGVGENGVGEDGGGENGVGEGVGVRAVVVSATATVTDLLTLPAELVAVMV